MVVKILNIFKALGMALLIMICVIMIPYLIIITIFSLIATVCWVLIQPSATIKEDQE